MKLRYIIFEGVQENKELYELADLILKEFSKVPEEKLFNTTIKLSQFKHNKFKYIESLVNSDIEIEITGRQSYYSSTYKVIRLSEREYLSNIADLKQNEIPDLKKIYNQILVHELQHAYDDIRSGGKYIQNKQSDQYYNSKYKSEYSYLRLPHEVWARFAELAEHINPYIRRSNIVNIVEDHIRGWEYLDEPMKKRILKAAYKLYDLKVQEFRNKNK